VPHPDPDVLVRVLDREGITSAWVGHLPSASIAIRRRQSRAATRLAPYADRLRAFQRFDRTGRVGIAP
jgi:hypothetical protein